MSTTLHAFKSYIVKEDIGNRVFKTREDRLDFLEGNFL